MSFLNINARELRKVIRKLSLEKSEARRAKHPIYWYYLDGKRVLRITFPNEHGGSGGVSSGFLNQIRNSFKITSDQFTDLVDCSLSAQAYEEIIRDKLQIDR